MKPDPYLRAESLLSEQEKSEFLTTFCAINPRYRGAHVADILEVLSEHDAHIGEAEDAYSERASEQTYLAVCLAKYIPSLSFEDAFNRLSAK